MNDPNKKIIDFAEIYSDKDKLNLNLNLKYNRFQQSTLLPSENLGGQAPSLQESPSGQGMRESREDRKPRRLSPEERYVQIAVQMAHIRTGTRTNRAKVYISLMSDDSNLYNVKLSGALTNDMFEIKRGAKDKQQVHDVIDQFINRHHEDLMLARLHYRANLYFNKEFTRKNLTSVLLAVYPENDILVAELFIYNEFIKIPLDEELSAGQKKYYNCAGNWKQDLDNLDE